MKKWYLAEDLGIDYFETELEATSKEEAFKEGKDIFDRLTKHDQNRRHDVLVVKAETDEDGCIIWHTINNEDVFIIKERR